MLRRLFWFVLGVVAGVYGVTAVKKKAAELGEKLTLANAVELLVATAKQIGESIVAAWNRRQGGDTDMTSAP